MAVVIFLVVTRLHDQVDMVEGMRKVASEGVERAGQYGMPSRGRTSRRVRKHNSTKRNMNAVVRVFERWLRVNSNDERPILAISPEELDLYLVDFFTTIKKPSGDDYTPLSLCVYRTSLEKYLKEHEYGASLMSVSFRQSQKAFRQKKIQLEEAMNQAVRPNNTTLFTALSSGGS